MTDPIMDKLKKLISHQESAAAIGSMQEAEAFAEKISELLLRHKLEMSDVEFYEFEVKEPIDKEKIDLGELGIKRTHRRIPWQEFLAGYVARANFCRTLVSSGSNNIWFVRRTSDRQVCAYLYGYLVRTITAEMNRQYSRAGRAGENIDGFRKGFIDGAIASLANRLQAPHKKAEEMAELNGDKRALVIIQTAKQEVDAFIKATCKGSAGGIGGSTRTSGSNGYNRGSRFGADVSLNRSTGRIGGSQGKLT